MISEYNFVVNMPFEPRTASARTILGIGSQSSVEGGLMEQALKDFIKKNDDYEDASDALHIVGQVSDLYRKVIKLKKAVIDSKPLNGETVASLLQDVFGHALLGMYYESKRGAHPAETWQAFAKDTEKAWPENPTAIANLSMRAYMLANDCTWRAQETGDVYKVWVNPQGGEVCGRLAPNGTEWCLRSKHAHPNMQHRGSHSYWVDEPVKKA